MSREKRLANKILKRDSYEIRTPVATEMFLPNHSGDHSAGKVFTTPTDDYHIANKKYVDDNIGGGGSISSLSDTTITALGTDELLFTQDGATWINQTLAEAGIQAVLAEGAFANGDKTKLDGIESGADVTDTANVTAAGALMDSEVDADIKTLSLPANTTISTFGASLIDDAAASNARTTLGLGDFAVLNTTTDHGTADTTYVPLVLYNTDATPPVASTVPIGTLYIQYTA